MKTTIELLRDAARTTPRSQLRDRHTWETLPEEAREGWIAAA